VSAVLFPEPEVPDGSGLGGDGRTDTMAPGPLLATVLGAVAGEDGEGLASMSDDQIIGFLSGTRRMESHLAWAKMAALAAVADAKLAESRTHAELRRVATRLVNRLDPEAVRKRKEKRRRETHVQAFREDSGNAGITGRELPSVEVLASMQHIEGRARALRDAGMPGTWQELKARALRPAAAAAPPPATWTTPTRTTRAA